MKQDLIKSNFYEAVNGEWLSEAKIPNDQPSMSAFLELHLGIEKLLMDLTSKWEKDDSNLNAHLKKYIKLYQMTKDFDMRNKLGSSPFKVVLDRINQLKNMNDFSQSFKALTYDGLDLPFGYYVAQDFMNSNNQILYFGASDLFLPDTSYYKDEKTKDQMMGMFKETSKQLLVLLGFSESEALTTIDEAISFDALLVPVTKSSVEKADYVKQYNPFKKDEVKHIVHTFDVMALGEQLVNQPIEQLIIQNPDFIRAFDSIINDDNFKKMKSWMIVSNAFEFANELTDDIRVVSGAFGRQLSGIKEAHNKEKFAFYQAYNRFGAVVGLYYGINYFGETAKKDVKTMVHEMIGVYEERIKMNTWLQEETKEKALKKLSTLTVHVGYPDELPSYFDEFDIKGYEEGSNLVLEKIKMSRIMSAFNFNKYNKAPNRNIWGMPASMVNAYYSPTNNQIVFPAAILQRPYYSLDQTPSENYGGIGAVMAHEISHAFDNNGAKFDEFGSLKNWWTEADLNAFTQKSEDMIKLFDGVDTGFGVCNGKLTVSENIADSGGLRCALEASKKNPSHNYDEFFKNWARVWRNKAALEYSQLLLRLDVHGPAILRVNRQLSNMIEFQQHYGVKDDDPMYLNEKDMVSIW